MGILTPKLTKGLQCLAQTRFWPLRPCGSSCSACVCRNFTVTSSSHGRCPLAYAALPRNLFYVLFNLCSSLKAKRTDLLFDLLQLVALLADVVQELQRFVVLLGNFHPSLLQAALQTLKRVGDDTLSY